VVEERPKGGDRAATARPAATHRGGPSGQTIPWLTTTEPGLRVYGGTQLASEYAERSALDHHGLDNAFWTRMRTAHTDTETVELSMCLGSWLGFGRLDHVLGLDAACVLSSHAVPRRRSG
jgi:hypothetical protein